VQPVVVLGVPSVAITLKYIDTTLGLPNAEKPFSIASDGTTDTGISIENANKKA
jgi:hypothetical protein